jgi:hypothetical protein
LLNAVEIEPDDNKPTAIFFEDVATRMIQNRHCLLFLESRDISLISIPELPTWVPDWSTALNVLSPIWEPWSASGFISGHNELLGNGILRTAGVRVAVVNQTHIFPENLTFDPDTFLTHIQRLIPAGFDESAYIGGGSLLDAYCHALYCSDSISDRANHPEHHLGVQEARDSMLSIWRSKISDSSFLLTDRFSLSLHRCTIGRSFVTTYEGYVGLAPGGAKPGDVLCVLLGVDVPILLRPTTPESTAEQRWQVVGSCNTPGLMFGEAIHGPLPNHYRSFRSPIASHAIINYMGVTVTDERDGTAITNPTKILDEMGIRWERYSRQPHLLEVLPETLRAAGVDLRQLYLV